MPLKYPRRISRCSNGDSGVTLAIKSSKSFSAGWRDHGRSWPCGQLGGSSGGFEARKEQAFPEFEVEAIGDHWVVAEVLAGGVPPLPKHFTVPVTPES
jgi:hypothetical protein